MSEKETAQQAAPAADTQERTAIITSTSLVGILTNFLLAAVKAVIGWVSGSLSVMLDGVNNLSDAGSSVITLLSAKLAQKPADKKHPYGYGRTEYLSTLIIALLILYAGISSLSESIQKIISGGDPEYSALSLWILAAAVLVKVGLGLYTERQAKKAGSESLAASGKDSLNDSLMSSAVLASALFFLWTGISLEAWVGLILSIFIIKSGFEILRDTLSEIIGERADSELSATIREAVLSVPGVLGAYDLFFHDYGPNRKIASIHVEVPDTWDAAKIDEVTRQIEQVVYQKSHVLLSAVGVYSKNTGNSQEKRIENTVRSILGKYPDVIQMHGFYVNEHNHEIRFDIIIGFDAPDRRGEYEQILDDCRRAFPDHQITITLDADISD